MKPWKPFTEKSGKFITQIETFKFARKQTVQKIIPKEVPFIFYTRIQHIKKCQAFTPPPYL